MTIIGSHGKSQHANGRRPHSTSLRDVLPRNQRVETSAVRRLGKSYNGLTSYFCLMSLKCKLSSIVNCQNVVQGRKNDRNVVSTSQLIVTALEINQIRVSVGSLPRSRFQCRCATLLRRTTLKTFARETNFPLDFNSCKIFQTINLYMQK